MLRLLFDKLQSMNTRKVFIWCLIISLILTAIMPIIAYKSSRDPVVGSIFGSCIMGLAFTIGTLIGNSCNSYFIVYIYFALTILHVILNIAISISFPLLILLVLNQIILIVVAFFHARNLRFYSGGNPNSPQYQYSVPENVRVEG